MLGYFNKVAGLQICSFFKIRIQQSCFLWILQSFYKQLFYRTAAVPASESPTTVQ